MNLKQTIHHFVLTQPHLEKLDFFIVRQDGIVLYEHSELDAQIAGALISGVWQASHALMSLLPMTSEKEYRFSFDTSHQGVYILNFKMLKQDFYLGLLFKEEMNPAVVKNKMRDFVNKLEFFVNKQNSMEPTSDVRKSYLFSTLEDREIDALFSFAGGE